jgi:hypothetical protein
MVKQDNLTEKTGRLSFKHSDAINCNRAGLDSKAKAMKVGMVGDSKIGFLVVASAFYARKSGKFLYYTSLVQRSPDRLFFTYERLS